MADPVGCLGVPSRQVVETCRPPHPRLSTTDKTPVQSERRHAYELAGAASPHDMTDSDSSITDRVVLAFQQQYWRDQAEGRDEPLLHYVGLWPDQDATIAREYLALRTPDDARTDRGESIDSDDGTIGPFVVNRELGRGGQGVVYKATDTRLGRTVALKVLTGLGPGAEGQLRRFRREAEIAAKLEHPGICGVHDTGIDNGVPWIAMRYVEGKTLANRIATTHQAQTAAPTSFLDLTDDDEVAASPTRDAGSDMTTTMSRAQLFALLQTFEKAARALHAAHEAGVLHRDIKPGNIMVSNDGDPVILDFGLARDDDDDLPSLTQTGDLFGTPAYMSPEQIVGQRIRLDARSDVYSLAVSLYECLTLRRPYDAPTREGLYQAVMTKDPPDPRRINHSIPKDLKVVLDCALEKDRDKRYATAAAFGDDLAAVRELRPIAARPIGVVGRTVRWAKRRPVRAALAALLIIGIPLVTGLAGFIWAKLPDIRRQEQARIDDAVEERLERGILMNLFDASHEAVSEFEAALALDPASVEAAAGLAWSYQMLGDARSSLDAIQRAEALVDDPRLLYPMKVVALRSLGREREAQNAANAVAAPDTALGWFMEGTVAHLEARKAPMRSAESRAAGARAEALYRRAVLASPRARRAYHYMLAGVVHIGGRSLEGLADVLQSSWPRDARAWSASAKALFHESPDRALAAFTTCLELARERSGLVRVLALGNMAELLRRQGRLDESIEAHKEMRRLAPSRVSGLNFGLALKERGHLEEAVAVYREALERTRGAKRAPLLSNLGVVLDQIGRPDEALKSHRAALALDPGIATAHFHVGKLLVNADRAAEALEHLHKATSVRPGDTEDDVRHEAWVFSHLGVAHAKLGDKSSALSALERALELRPDDLVVHYNAIRTVRPLGLGERTIEHCLKCVAIDPDYSADPYAILGDTYLTRGELDSAITYYEQAIKLKPDHAVAHHNLGTAWLNKPDYERAAEALRRGQEVESSPAHHPYLTKAVLTWVRQLVRDDERERAIEILQDYTEAFPGIPLFKKALEQVRKRP